MAPVQDQQSEKQESLAVDSSASPSHGQDPSVLKTDRQTDRLPPQPSFPSGLQQLDETHPEEGTLLSPSSITRIQEHPPFTPRNVSNQTLGCSVPPSG